MLRQHFAASIGASFRKADTSATKDAGVFVYEHQPLLAPRAVFKKSAAPPACLAVSSWHVFAAQADKAVVHVYSREKGSQEAIVPFPERITSLTLALDDTVLLLGTEGGRIILWEIYTGRSITGPQSHLQPVTALRTDPNSHHVFSGSSDSNIHVWTLSSLLSFTAPANPKPLHTLSNHRGALTALAVGHSSTATNILVSGSKDDTVIVWDYHTSTLLATYLLGDSPLALELDVADRGFYATYGDGSVQYVDFQVPGPETSAKASAISSLHDPETSYTPIQPPKSTRWAPSNQDLGAALCISLSWDSTTLITGHANGAVASWSPQAPQPFKTTLATLPGPVTNIAYLPPDGFPTAPAPRLKAYAIVKPRLDLRNATDAAADVASPVPAGYGFNAQLLGDLPIGRAAARKARGGGQGGKAKSAFEEALTHSSFPAAMLEASLAELRRAGSGSGSQAEQRSASTAAAVVVDGAVESGVAQVGSHDIDLEDADGARDVPISGRGSGDLEQQNGELRQQLEALQRVQKATFKQLTELRGEGKGKGEGEGVEGNEEEKKRRRERVQRALKGKR